LQLRGLAINCALMVLLVAGISAATHAQPQILVETSPLPRVCHRGSTLIFHVYASNHGPGDAYSPTVTVSISDPRNIIAIGSVTRNWAGTYLPSTGTKYGLGEFAFSVTSNTPDGQYSIRVELSYIWNRANYYTDKMFALTVEPSPSEIEARQAAERAAQERAKLRDIFLLGGVSTIAIVVTVAIVALLARHRSGRNHNASATSSS